MIAIGTAGWSIARASAASFGGDGSHLARYARVLPCVEINSSFYRPHRTATYARWAGETSRHFRFAVKLPEAITHAARLRRARLPLDAFLEEVAGLGSKLAVLLVQLPPSFAYEPRPVRTFFELLRERHPGAVVCEPRHRTWFTPAAERVLRSYRISRAAADPALCESAAGPGGWLGPNDDGADATLYYRWHGSPRIYWSAYSNAWLAARADELARWPSDADRWCIFDNTAAGAALRNALALQTMIGADVAKAGK